MTEGVICQRIPVQNSFIHKPSSKLQFHTRWVFYKAKRKAIIGSKLQLKCKELLYSSLADISLLSRHATYNYRRVMQPYICTLYLSKCALFT